MVAPPARRLRPANTSDMSCGVAEALSGFLDLSLWIGLITLATSFFALLRLGSMILLSCNIKALLAKGA
eukprot:8057090-Lingulodinium_polyedra.AAC.1